MKAALRAGDKARLGTIRLLLAAVKQREVDERISLDEAQIIALLDKQAKQRRESIAQYQAAGRADLEAQETYELGIIQSYLPKALGDDEIEALIAQAISATGASSIRDMGKVMSHVKPQIQGRADMASVSARVKAHLGG